MKHLFSIVGLLMCSCYINAQESDDYRPFIEEGKEWWSFENNLLCPFPEWRGSFVRHDFFDGDTIVAGKLCKRWMQRFTQRDTNNLAFTFTVSAYEEDKKVWFFWEGDTVQRLMFDFGASVGDEFAIEPPDALLRKVISRAEEEGLLSPEENVWKTLYQRPVYVFSEKDSVLEQRSYRMIGISGYTDNHAGSNWVLEGVGSCSRPDWIFEYSDAFYSSRLTCCIIGDEVLYLDEDAARYYQIPIPTSLLLPQTIIRKYPNPHCYDLTGRRLAATPKKGVYIEGGKKKAAK